MDWYSDGTAFYAGRFEDQICNWIFLARLFELKSIFLYCWFACGFFFSKFKFFGFLFFFLRFVCSFWGICMVYLKFLFYLKHATLSHVHIVPTLGNFLWILNWYWRNIINSSAFSLSLFECVLILKNYFCMYVLVYHHPSGLARCIFWGNIHYIMVLYVVCGSAQSSYNERTVCMLQCSVCTRCTLAFSFPFSVAR